MAQQRFCKYCQGEVAQIAPHLPWFVHKDKQSMCNSKEERRSPEFVFKSVVTLPLSKKETFTK